MDLRDVLHDRCWTYSGTPIHHLYQVTGAQVVEWREQGLLRVWSCNRKFDHARVAEIRRYQDERDHVNGTLHFAQLPGEGIVCYEGNHRFQAVTPAISVVILDVMWNATEDDVYAEFNAINSAQLVPKIFKKKLDDPEKLLRKQIEDFANEICLAHPKLATTKERANRPGFVRSDLIDRIHKQYKFFLHNGGYTLDELFKAIDYLNYAVAEGQYELESSLKPSSRRRAEASGFYLYVANEPLSRGDLRWALSELDK